MNYLFSSISKTIFSLLLLTSFLVSAQYSQVDERVRNYPKTFSSSKLLADRINSDFSKDDEKARAIFTWIAVNIRYDLADNHTSDNIAFSYTTAQDRIQKEKQFRQALVNSTLKSSQAVCEGYASLFSSLSELTGLEAVIIPGTSRSDFSKIGELPNESDHAWNAVRINEKWELVDATWAAGIVNADKGFIKIFNDAYFFPTPEKFFLNHFPDDPKWLLIDRTAKQFADQPFYYPSYIKSDYKLNKENGVIKFSGDDFVEFHIENLRDSDRVYYITSRDNVLDKLSVDANHSFRIYPSSKLNGYLTIFVNEKPIVSYKILRI